MHAVPAEPSTVTADQLATRLLDAAAGTADLFAVYLGDRLGYYRALADGDPITPAELAARTGCDPRYTREWLEQQSVAGLLSVDTSDPGSRRYVMPPAVAEVLTDEQSLNYQGPLGRLFASVGGQLPALIEAYRTGGGVGWASYGADAREAQADMNRPWYEHALPGALRSAPSIDEPLRRPGARIADLGCGGAWSTIALARAYPGATLDGIDIDDASVRLARENVAAAGLTDRVTIHRGNAAELPAADYDIVFAFECVHDMPQPVDVLATARRALRDGGSVVVMDEAVAETFTAPGDEVDRLSYGFSLLICLPDSMAHRPTVATGTVMRPDVLRGYARSAGFADLEILPIDDFGSWRFYRLVP